MIGGGDYRFFFMEMILFLFHCLLDWNGLREVIEIIVKIKMLFKILCIHLSPPKSRCQDGNRCARHLLGKYP